MTRIQLETINSLLKEEAFKLQGEVAILSLVEWLVEHIIGNVKPEQPESSTTDVKDEFTIVSQLDHIRSRTIYVKTLSQWFRELSLHGVLVFYRKLIFLMVSGSKDGLQVTCMRQV